MAQDGAEAADALKVILKVHRRWKDSEPKEKRPVQGAFGKILGVSQSTVSRWVEGEGLPRGDQDLLRAINSLLKRESFTTLLEETERSSLDAICEALDKVVTKAKRPRKESFRPSTPDDSISHEGRASFFRDYAAALPSYLEYEVASLSVTFVRMSTLGPGFVAPSLYPIVPAEDRTRLDFDSFAESVAHGASKTLIVGGGGEGKSTLLARLCTELLQAGQVPLWLRARDLIDSCIDDLPAIARKSVARVASGYVGDLSWGVDNAVAVLADDRCILLIDDLDDIGHLGATSAMRLLRDLVATRGRVVATSRGLHPAIQFQSVFRLCPPHEAVLRAKWSFDQKPGVTDHGSPLLVAISAFISSGSAADRLSDAFVLALAEWQRSASVPPTTSPANACGMVLALQNLALRLLDPVTPIEEVQRLEPTIHTVARLAAAPELEALEAAVAVGLVVSLAHARRFASRHIHELLAAAALARGGPMAERIVRDVGALAATQYSLWAPVLELTFQALKVRGDVAVADRLAVQLLWGSEAEDSAVRDDMIGTCWSQLAAAPRGAISPQLSATIAAGFKKRARWLPHWFGGQGGHKFDRFERYPTLGVLIRYSLSLDELSDYYAMLDYAKGDLRLSEDADGLLMNCWRYMHGSLVDKNPLANDEVCRFAALLESWGQLPAPLRFGRLTAFLESTSVGARSALNGVVPHLKLVGPSDQLGLLRAALNHPNMLVRSSAVPPALTLIQWAQRARVIAASEWKGSPDVLRDE